jgi:multidrug efflux pump subunit AcrB
MQSRFVGFGVAMFGIFLLLTMQFRSYAQPLIIMAVIPFGMIGAILGHLVQGMPLTFFTMMGVVALSGVVVNDSIVLVDFINRRLAEGMDLHEALIQAGRQRFRPVLLTTLTTIAGLMPILVERSMQAQLLIPMATSLSCGLAVATMWILLLVPLMYQVYARWLPGSRPIEDSADTMPALAMDEVTSTPPNV